MLKKSAYLGVLLLFLFAVISCEKDFTDINSSVITNNVFETKDTILDITINQEDIDKIRTDGGISLNLGEYLLGVYKSENNDYRKIDASIVSQIGFLSNLKVIEKTFDTPDTIVETRMDKVLIRIPYQATDTSTVSGERRYKIENIGKPTEEVSVKVYRNLTFLNTLNPMDPTQNNEYYSDDTYTPDLSLGSLTEDVDFKFTVPQNDITLDTMFVFDRNLSNGETFEETIKINNSAPFFTIPLKKEEFKTLFLDEYDGSNFESADAFNNYFRGLIIEASGADGTIVPFNFTSGAPTLDIYYTNTVSTNGAVIDTIAKTNSFPLSGIRNSIYTASSSNMQTAETFAVQGTVGTLANINILQGTQIADLLDEDKEWLINDASLIFYVDKARDTTFTPERLFLFKNEQGNPSQIKDAVSEGFTVFGGTIQKTESGAVDNYRFRITDYISDLFSGESTYNPPLGLRVYNPTDMPTSTVDTVVRSYNWNPRGIVLHNNTTSNTARKAQLKISYSVKK